MIVYSDGNNFFVAPKSNSGSIDLDFSFAASSQFGGDPASYKKYSFDGQVNDLAFAEILGGEIIINSDSKSSFMNALELHEQKVRDQPQEQKSAYFFKTAYPDAYENLTGEAKAAMDALAIAPPEFIYQEG